MQHHDRARRLFSRTPWSCQSSASVSPNLVPPGTPRSCRAWPETKFLRGSTCQANARRTCPVAIVLIVAPLVAVNRRRGCESTGAGGVSGGVALPCLCAFAPPKMLLGSHCAEPLDALLHFGKTLEISRSIHLPLSGGFLRCRRGANCGAATVDGALFHSCRPCLGGTPILGRALSPGAPHRGPARRSSRFPCLQWSAQERSAREWACRSSSEHTSTLTLLGVTNDKYMYYD